MNQKDIIKAINECEKKAKNLSNLAPLENNYDATHRLDEKAYHKRIESNKLVELLFKNPNNN